MFSRFLHALTLTALLGVTAVLAGCGGETNTRPPALLQPISTQLTVKQLWSASIGSGNDGYFLHLHPYISGSVLYAADHGGTVAAYALKDGHQLWSVDTGYKLVGGVSGGGDMLFVGAQDGKVIGISLKQRGVIWQTQLSSEVMALSEATQGEVVVHTNDGDLYALDVATGNVLWNHSNEPPNLMLRGKSQPLLVGGHVISGFASGKLSAYSLDTGNQLWQVSVGEPSGASALQRLVDVDGRIALSATGDTVYAVGYNGNAIAVQSSDGQVIWSHPLSSYAGLAAGSDAVFVTDSNSDIWALDRNTGASLWKQDALHFREVTAPAVVDDKYVVVGDYAGYLQWISARDGTILARDEVDIAGINATPVVVGNIVYVQGAGGQLAAYQVIGPSPKTGQATGAPPKQVGGFNF